jgi:hypothetical protein
MKKQIVFCVHMCLIECEKNYWNQESCVSFVLFGLGTIDSEDGFCCDCQGHTAIFAVNGVAEYKLKKDTRRGKCIVY